MQRNWTEIGKPTVNGRMAHYSEIFDSLEYSMPKDGPMGPIMAINTAIKELQLPKVSGIAWTNACAPLGLYGIEANYKNGRARIYILDFGDSCIPICSDFYPKDEAAR